jgi:hypothetical protein
VASLEDASAQATTAFIESHSRHMRMERVLMGAGLASDEAQVPEYQVYRCLWKCVGSRWPQGGMQFGLREVEEYFDEEVDRGIGAQAELTPGVPMCVESTVISQ